ncbi:hypothetical protein KVT40_001434 [Elsinoe batatas]|uniref:Uncharacterized protein n=1 Tax=Elsinoe batatas TaxID=2601811 RepID=A0A8K0L978_9PEZI|nr:hypothetical protein KVT40_001434 [Elsinoe batatas]
MKYSLVLAGLAATAYAIPQHHTKSTKIKTTKHHKTTTTSKIATTTSSIRTTVVPPASSSASTWASPSATPSAAPAPSGCVVTDFAAIPAAVAKCTSITLKNIHAPSNQTIDLQKLLPHTTVTFAGTTTFDFTNISSFDPIVISGTDITVTAEPHALLDGNGPIYWDGLGSNGGVPKPNHFIVLKKINGGVVKDLKIKNWPVHLFSISGCNNVDMFDLYLDNSDGFAPNYRSNGLPAAHNSDGFDLISSTDFTIRDSVVLNQDDCVAITSGDNVKVDNMYCEGGHGLSIGSVGGKSNNNVTNISACTLPCPPTYFSNIPSLPTPSSSTPRTALASRPTPKPPALSPTSPTATSLFPTSVSTASTSSRTTSMVVQQATRPMV